MWSKKISKILNEVGKKNNTLTSPNRIKPRPIIIYFPLYKYQDKLLGNHGTIIITVLFLSLMPYGYRRGDNRVQQSACIVSLPIVTTRSNLMYITHYYIRPTTLCRETVRVSESMLYLCCYLSPSGTVQYSGGMV